MTFAKLGVYQTYLDLNIAAQSTQSITSDGAFTLAGMTWTKGNSANESTHLAITNGSGAVFVPASTSNYFIVATTSSPTPRTLPYMWLPFNQIGGLASLSWQSKIRVWANISADNCTAVDDGSVLAIDNNNTTISYPMSRGYSSNGQGIAGNSGTGTLNDTNLYGSTLTLGNGNRIMMLDIDLNRFSTSLFVCSNTTVWPDPSTMTIMGTQTLVNTNLATNGFGTPYSTMGILLGAQRNGSATALSITIANLRVDVLQFE